MRDAMLFFLMLLMLLLVACDRAEPVKPAPVDVVTVDDKIQAAVDSKSAAVKSGNRLKVLEAERDELRARFDKAKAEEEQYKGQLDTNNKNIRQEHMDIAQARAYWVAGISGFLGAVALAASFFVSVPLLRNVIRWAALTFGALAVIALIFAWLVPYIVPIVSVMGVLAAAGAIWQWRTDHRGLNQLVEAVEPIKRQVEGANEDLRKALSSDVRERVSGIRTRLGLKQNDDSGHG